MRLKLVRPGNKAFRVPLALVGRVLATPSGKASIAVTDPINHIAKTPFQETFEEYWNALKGLPSRRASDTGK